MGLLRLGGEEEDEIVADPLSDEFYEHIWKKTAETNTLIYRDVFRCVPDDTGTLQYKRELKLTHTHFFL